MNLIASIRRALTGWLFARGEHEVSTFEIILWWEKRRVPYNLIVGVAGLFTCAVTVAVAVIASDKFGEPLGLPDPPIFAVLAVIAYGVGANVCYTGGWISEALVRKIWQERTGAFGQITFVLGLVFSVLITLAPAALFSVLLIARLVLR
jgi:hypothetical protein